jgi:transmembrane 9 superfamily protein 2/4
MFAARLALVLLAFSRLAAAFYLPGLAPKSYCKRGFTTPTCTSQLDVFVNRLDSVEAVLPYEYAHFDFCQAAGAEASPSENLGQVGQVL